MSAEHLRVGWIGTGRMGHAMVTRLLAAGQDVHVWNRTRAKAEDLAAHGAVVVDSVADLAERDVVFTMVAADDDLLEVTLGEGGLLRRPGCAPSYLVDSTTISAQTSERIRQVATQCGTALLAAPVSGNAKVVKAGRLSVAVSGPRAAYDTLEPLLRLLGHSVTYVGEADVARLVKLAHNIFLGVVTQSLAEITVLAQQGGVPRAALLEFINGSVLGSAFSRYKSPAFVGLDLTPTFTTTLLRKDFDLGLDAARRLQVPLPLAAAAHQLVQQAVGRGHGEEDFAALLVEQARSSGIELVAEDTPVDDGLSEPEGRLGAARGTGVLLTAPAIGETACRYLPALSTGGSQMPGAIAPPPPSPGRMAVDFEERVDFDRLRRYRLARTREALDASELGALLLFDINNIRYVSSTMIGEWARDKVARYTLLTRRGEPIVWDFGSAARHHRLYAPWIEPVNSRPGMLGLRGSVAPDAGLVDRAVAEIASILAEEGVADLPLGVDIAETPMFLALQHKGIQVRDAQQVMLDARLVKSGDEIKLLSTAAAMVDGVYQDITEALKPGVRENEIVALANKRLYEMGSDDVEAINAVSGERCNPHPHNFSDRIVRPGDQVYFDIIQSFNGYRTCYYRTFAVGRATPAQRDAYVKAREWIDAAIDLARPGVTTDQIARLWPRAEEFGFESEMAAFGLQFGHGLGLGLHERPIISRLNSLEHPVELREGMVFALETYCPAADGYSAARIEEEVVVTADGPSVLTLFPAEELFVTNKF